MLMDIFRQYLGFHDTLNYPLQTVKESLLGYPSIHNKRGRVVWLNLAGRLLSKIYKTAHII